jgi:hypothetical protein
VNAPNDRFNARFSVGGDCAPTGLYKEILAAAKFDSFSDMKTTPPPIHPKIIDLERGESVVCAWVVRKINEM